MKTRRTAHVNMCEKATNSKNSLTMPRIHGILIIKIIFKNYACAETNYVHCSVRTEHSARPEVCTLSRIKKTVECYL